MKKEEFEDMLLKSANQAMDMAKLLDQLEMLKEVVEFYADTENWTKNDIYAWSTGQSSITFSDMEMIFNDGNNSDQRGGKKARSVLEKLNKM